MDAINEVKASMKETRFFIETVPRTIATGNRGGPYAAPARARSLARPAGGRAGQRNKGTGNISPRQKTAWEDSVRALLFLPAFNVGSLKCCTYAEKYELGLGEICDPEILLT